MQTRSPQRRDHDRQLAPVRWPRPDAGGVALGAAWVAGTVLGIGLPAAVVPPHAVHPSDGRVIGAFATTLAGAAVMIAAAIALYRRYREPGLLVFAVVPPGVVVAGGFVVMGLKLFA